MKRITKDLAEKMVVDVLITLSKTNETSMEFAKDSIDIINDPIDNVIFTAVILSKARPSLFEEHEDDMKYTVLSALQTVYSFAKEEPLENFEFSEDLSKEFCHIDQNKCSNSTKLNFALIQFVNGFYEYERLEKKYPELMKIM